MTMGGKAFAHLNTPRMSHASYARLSAQVVEALKACFVRVRCPPESPGKADHGDVDVLVEEWRGSSNLAEVVRVLGATEWIGHLEAGSTTNLAIPAAEDRDPQIYRQVDLLVCHQGMLEWESFTKSYGDLWNILGSMIGPFGLTTNDRGLFLRIPGFETVDRKKSMILLTKEPTKVVPFLGLDHDAFERGWKGQAEMFQWAKQCRFFRKEVFRRDGEELKANDRKRLKVRPVYRSWVMDYLPALSEPASSPNTWVTREEILEETLEEFDVRKAYGEKLADHRATQSANRAWRKISEAIPLPRGQEYGKVMRGLKDRISLLPGNDAKVHSELTLPPFWESNQQIDEYLLCTWVSVHWKTIRDLQKGLDQTRLENLSKNLEAF
jgi:hypothetical protein